MHPEMEDPVEEIDGDPASGALFLCDHASNALPQAYGTLGLPPADLNRHIAFDIGAAWVTRHLASYFSAPAILSRFSRLLIDPNRGADDPTLVMRLSDRVIVPGNARIGKSEIEHRLVHYWRPYRAAISRKIGVMLAHGVPPAIVSVHSFTPCWKSKPRPWEIGILWDNDPRLAKPLIEALAGAGFCVGDNEPYDGALAGDTLDEQVTCLGLAGVLLELRQDLVQTEPKAEALAEHVAEIIAPILERPELHRKAFFESRIHRYL